MYKIKQKPEDFKVTEAIDIDVKERGEYAYFWLTKSGFNTVSVINRIADFCCVKHGRVGFAGAKDKIAVTKQAISIRDPSKKIHPEAFKHFNSNRIKLEYIGRGTAPISLGDLEGNSFDIVVESDRAPEEVDWFVNYFDDQRFSINNHLVGEAMIKKDWKTAATEAINDDIKRHLNSVPTDFVGAFRKVPLKIRLMYVHSFQSMVWNEAVCEYLQCKYKDLISRRYTIGKVLFPKETPKDADFKVQMPIVGFGTEYKDDNNKKIIKQILEEHSVSERDFIIPSMPELSCDGGIRPVFVKMKNFSITEIRKDTYRLKFFLPSGSYATMAIKRIFGE